MSHIQLDAFYIKKNRSHLSSFSSECRRLKSVCSCKVIIHYFNGGGARFYSRELSVHFCDYVNRLVMRTFCWQLNNGAREIPSDRARRLGSDRTPHGITSTYYTCNLSVAGRKFITNIRSMPSITISYYIRASCVQTRFHENQSLDDDTCTRATSVMFWWDFSSCVRRYKNPNETWHLVANERGRVGSRAVLEVSV